MLVDFVDINPKTGLLDTNSLKAKLEWAKNCGKLPKVVVPVHLTGSSCDMKVIGDLVRFTSFTLLRMQAMLLEVNLMTKK